MSTTGDPRSIHNRRQWRRKLAVFAVVGLVVAACGDDDDDDNAGTAGSATAEATEEAILNAMLAADTMTGADYWRYYGLPHAELKEVLRKHGRLVEKKTSQ